MNALEEFARIIAEDIREYIAKGGTFNELDPQKVYEDNKQLKQEE